MTDCPAFEPAEGSTCSEENQVCVFENCRPPGFNDSHLLTCIEGAWTVTDVTVCELEACPDSLPVVGTICNERITPGPCGFVNACDTYVEVECVAGTWQAVGAEDSDAPGQDPALPAPMCPAYPPYLGDRCCPTSVPEVCDYSATASGTDGAAGASFLIDPGSTSSGGGGGAEPPPTLTCAVCTPQMTWGYCNPE